MNVARLLYIGCRALHFSERDVMGMTPRKFFLIFDEHLEMNGLKKESAGIDGLP